MHSLSGNEDNRRKLAWIYLRRAIEASRHDLLELLYEGKGETDPEKLAHRIYRRDDTLPDAILSTTSQRWDHDPRKDAEFAKRHQHRLVTPDDAEWPSSLEAAFGRMRGGGADADGGVRGQAAAPFAFWVHGTRQLDASVRRAVTMVGTRAASAYGKSVTSDLARRLAGDGITVVSGGAMGIDTVAHTAALEAGGATVAVLACGLDVNYPIKNAQLFQQITHNGVLVSEYAPGTSPARHRFLTRNRLVAGFGQVAVMVEAALRSGAINTMNWAEAMVVPNLVVPGPINSTNAQGCLLRIQQQRAELLRTYEDILVALEPVGTQLELGVTSGEQMLSWEQTAVFDACLPAKTASEDVPAGDGELTAILASTGLEAREVIRALRQLESNGLVVREGAQWRRHC
ncbi:DNA-processing protein DprA [Corynebacterium resistens]|nr:DNA-processing protein DprA [Corynebacterium resistens]